MRASMVAQRAAGLVAAQLEIIGRDADILLAQIFRENAPDFAVADEADIPLSGIGCGHGQIFRTRVGIIASGFLPSR
jgi:hypothetical protein